MEYKPRGLAKLLGWILEILFPRHYALLNYVHVTRDAVPMDPRRLRALPDAARAGGIKKLFGFDKADGQ
jgi:hypothetical protein